ncbi:uncharacterized protein LOC112351088 [Selaginella moellendorffii]|uniref:uncharacterized protein LOC112351088 n=1 Tax=Selaginella moellendorffii TaxID=88036 RepID=UPI000D1C7D00|nr:uncharacterized protein LOC112351088 [Selaginella moellendorffii]|eukprot:XP_024544058.1 uncharacterized protein LOC112351088 [Selaginella moellendorffii]
MEELTEAERRALRGSKFAPLRQDPDRSGNAQPRLAHPGGALTTNKAAALAKFLERKLKEPGSLSSLDPDIVERAVLNAKAAVNPGKHSTGLKIRHVASFSDSEEESMKRTAGPSSSLSVAAPVIDKKKKNKKNKKGKNIMKKKKKKQKQKHNKQN